MGRYVGAIAVWGKSWQHRQKTLCKVTSPGFQEKRCLHEAEGTELLVPLLFSRRGAAGEKKKKTSPCRVLSSL